MADDSYTPDEEWRAIPGHELLHLSKAQRKNGMKNCVCADCGIISTVRRDTNPVVCRRCASSRGGRSGKGSVRSDQVSCAECGKMMRASLGQKFCSLECRHANTHENRQCKHCLKQFDVYKSSIGANTNAEGNFCSRPCYENWMCQTDRITGRGSQWNKIRLKAKKRMPFCAMCGTTKLLQVHHIAPFRLSFDNSQQNLITLCIKHHKFVESITHDIESTGSSCQDMKVALGAMLMERAMVTATVIKARINAHC
jgi:hypothetical protein